MSTLANLRSSLRNRVHIIEVPLGTMEVSAPTPASWPPPCPGRLLTDTREDILDSYDANDELVIRTRSEYNTAEAFQSRATDTTATCRIHQCSGCKHNPCNKPTEPNEQEYLELNADALEARSARNSLNDLIAKGRGMSFNLIKMFVLMLMLVNTWHPMIDLLELKTPPLHFGRVVRGRLAPCTKIFLRGTTSSTDVNDSAPKRLTRRHITSKHMGVFDIKGLLIPLTARCKPALRDVFKETPT